MFMLPNRLRLFWKKTIAGPNNCIVWIGSKSLNGYGKFWYGNRLGEAHRFSYEAKNGYIPDGLCIDHLCRNRLCVNPNHLEVVTQQENILRGTGFSAKYAAATHCSKGHPFDEVNTYWRPDGTGRDCRICRQIISRLSKRRTRAALRLTKPAPLPHLKGPDGRFMRRK